MTVDCLQAVGRRLVTVLLMLRPSLLNPRRVKTNRRLKPSPQLLNRRSEIIQHVDRGGGKLGNQESGRPNRSPAHRSTKSEALAEVESLLNR